jgi:hypothetical protein
LIEDDVVIEIEDDEDVEAAGAGGLIDAIEAFSSFK